MAGDDSGMRIHARELERDNTRLRAIIAELVAAYDAETAYENSDEYIYQMRHHEMFKRKCAAWAAARAVQPPKEG